MDRFAADHRGLAPGQVPIQRRPTDAEILTMFLAVMTVGLHGLRGGDVVSGVHLAGFMGFAVAMWSAECTLRGEVGDDPTSVVACQRPFVRFSAQVCWCVL
jgi:hypothetical protein